MGATVPGAFGGLGAPGGGFGAALMTAPGAAGGGVGTPGFGAVGGAAPGIGGFGAPGSQRLVPRGFRQVSADHGGGHY